MDINDIFRGFFGFTRFPPRNSQDFQRDDDGDDEIFRNKDPFNDPFDDDFPSLFRNMENMFNNMFSIHSGILDFPNLETPLITEVDPRNAMLKDSNEPNLQRPQCVEPYCSQRQQPMRDVDLDEKVSKGGLSALTEEFPVQERTPRTYSFRKSISTKVIRSADGTIEEHKSVTDSDGKTVTTVRKTIGDKTYQVRTESDKSGIIEKKEDFINLDEKELDDFQRDLHKRPVIPLLKAPNDSKEDLLISAPPGDPKYIQIFKKFFG